LPEAGPPIGTPDAERAPPGTTPVLRLIRGPETIHQPGQATWPLEMHHVYRLDASPGVDPASVELEISLGERSAGATHREALGLSLSYLKLFGLDENAPFEALDEVNLLQPERDLFGAVGGPTGTSRFGGPSAGSRPRTPSPDPPPPPTPAPPPAH